MDAYERRKLAAGILVTILLLILMIGEGMRDRAIRFWLGVIVCSFVTLVVLVWLALSPVLAHDHMRPDLTPWFKTLHSGKGMCCDGYDALHLRDVDWETQNLEHSHYRVRIPKNSFDMAKAVAGETVDTMWVDVPDDAVIDEPNKDGQTLVWPLYGYMGVSIRCFMPGPMT